MTYQNSQAYHPVARAYAGVEGLHLRAMVIAVAGVVAATLAMANRSSADAEKPAAFAQQAASMTMPDPKTGHHMVRHVIANDNAVVYSASPVCLQNCADEVLADQGKRPLGPQEPAAAKISYRIPVLERP